MAEIYLGIDIGTTSAKCLAVDSAGRVLELAQQGYPMKHAAQGWAEQDPEDYWSALVHCVRECVSKVDGEIVSLAMSAQADTLIAVDSDGAALTPAISWMDGRAEKQFSEMVAVTGQEFWYSDTGSPLVSRSSACKIRWIQEEQPETWARTARLCYVPDLLSWRLCGRYAADVPSLSLCSLGSPITRGYSGEVLDLLDIDIAMLGEVVESGVTIGALTPGAASELGLSQSVRVVSGAFDQTAAAHGAGATPGRRGVLSCGTAWVLYCVISRPTLDPTGRLPICCHARPTEWASVMPFVGGSAYDWLGRTLAQDSGEPTDGDPPVFIPHLYGGLCPDWKVASRGSLVGLEMAHTPADIRLALMRGLASEARRNLEAFEEMSDPIESITMVGGAGKSDVMPALVANVLNKRVEVSDCVESACYGAAKLAAGDLSEQWPGLGVAKAIDPEPDIVSREDRHHNRYLRFYEVLLSAYED